MYCSKEEILNNLRKYSKGDKSGLPVYYDNNSLYYENSNNNLIICSDEEKKYELIFKPILKMSILAGESIVCFDNSKELLNNMENLLKENDYVILNEIKYNPLTIPYELYKKDENKCLEMLDKIACYLFYDEDKDNDPYWINMSRDYFKGLVIYLFKNKGKITLRDVLNFSNENDSLFLEDNSKEKILLFNIINAPKETKGSILSVFKQKLGLYALNDKYNQEFDLNILNNKFAIFSNKYNSINTLFINEIIEYRNNMMHIFINLFDNNEFIDKNYLYNSKNYNLKFTLFVYKINNYDIISGFNNILYLLSNNIETLDCISKLCGKNNKDELLVSVSDLMTLKNNDAIIIIPRLYPIKTVLIPYSDLT